MQRAVKRGCDHIFFIGFLGAGKSTLARNLGRLFHRRFVDTDRLVERSSSASVTELFAREGEQGFRKRETAALRGLGRERSLLVSCGGGIVETPENILLMKEMGTCVYLDLDIEDSLRQIRCPERRPDLGSAEHAAEVYRRRRPLYEGTADLTVDIRNKSFEQVASESGQLLWERGLL